MKMTPYVGLWDALFGKRVTVRCKMKVRHPTGGVTKVQAIQKWLDRNQEAGQMKDVTFAKGDRTVVRDELRTNGKGRKGMSSFTHRTGETRGCTVIEMANSVSLAHR